jgi:hypothetical protein
VIVLPDASGGYVLDAWGALHPFAIGSGTPPPPSNVGFYLPGAAALVAMTIVPDGGAGYAVGRDGQFSWPFAVPGPTTSTNRPGGIATATWCSQDILRGITAIDARSGYTLDFAGGLHPYGPADNIEACPVAIVAD